MKIIIAGAGEIGSHLAKMLSNEANDITVIDSDPQRLEALAVNTDIVTLEGNTSSISVIRSAGADRADLFIAVNPSDSQDVNVVSAILAKKLGTKRVIARINNEEYLSFENKSLFTEMGIDLLFYPEKIAVNEIVSLLKRTIGSDSLMFARGKLQMSVFKVTENSPLEDMKLIDFSRYATTDDMQFRVVAVSRNNETIMPKVDTRFRLNDLVYIIAKRAGMEMLMNLLGERTVEVNRVMILGGSPIGEILATQLVRQVDGIEIIDMDADHCREMAEKLDDRITVVHGDGRNSDFLVEENIRGFDAFVAVTDNSETNILTCVAAKKLGVPRTVAEVENLEYIRLAEDMGVDAVINKKLITAGRIFKFTLSDKVRFIRYMSGTTAEVLEYLVATGSRITGGSLMELDFPKNAIVGGVIRGSESYIAVGSTRIQPYDRVIVFALPETVKEVDRFFR